MICCMIIPFTEKAGFGAGADLEKELKFRASQAALRYLQKPHVGT